MSKNYRKYAFIFFCFVMFFVALNWAFNAFVENSPNNETREETDGNSGDNSAGGNDYNGSGKAEDDFPDDPSKEIVENPIIAPTIEEYSINMNSEITNASEASEVLIEVAQELGLGEDSELLVESSSDDGLGRIYYRLQQTYKGLPIIGASSVLEVNGSRAETIYGGWIDDLDLDIVPTYTALEAINMAFDLRGISEIREITFHEEPILSIIMTTEGAVVCWQITASVTSPDMATTRYAIGANDAVILAEELERLH